MCPWGFESPSRYYLPYGVIGNTTDFGSVIGESYSSRATLYIMYARTLLYILAIYKKNSIIARTCGESSHPPLLTSLSGVLPHYYTSLGPQKFGAKIPQLFSFAKMHLVLEFLARYSFVILCMTRISKKRLIVLLSILFEDLKILRYERKESNCHS